MRGSPSSVAASPESSSSFPFGTFVVLSSSSSVPASPELWLFPFRTLNKLPATLVIPQPHSLALFIAATPFAPPAPALCRIENVEPVATLPILDCQNGANKPMHVSLVRHCGNCNLQTYLLWDRWVRIRASSTRDRRMLYQDKGKARPETRRRRFDKDAP